MEGAASAPTHPELELEPPEWQPRAMALTARLLCGAGAFFYVSFVFAYFYLRSLDTNNSWKIGHVSPPTGWGIIIAVVLILSAVALRAAVVRPDLVVPAGSAALVLALLSIVFQVLAWTVLGFGPASGGYASVYVGWTAWFAVFTLPCAFWIETEVATAWRHSRGDIGETPAEIRTDPAVTKAGLDACSFVWNFYVFAGIVLFVLLYLL